ncbi:MULTISPECIES: YchJ family protein [unclassified Psychrobacter]|jgi:SEC-C motif-containing protein|uniref:YchJ family protein n=1 Tax=unclassified Psychrobacter TaxID=196806 RepID=UPI00040B0155|nr:MULTISPECIES: YchJ family protein [unclassified Psychrobacter]
MQPNLHVCPCQIHPSSSAISSPLLYKDCCQPYHEAVYNDALYIGEVGKADGIKAETAERLMRTRYSAFVLIKPDYIVKTTLTAQQGLLDIKAIESWAKETDWAGLEIVQHTPKLGKCHSQVEFKAYFKTNEDLQAHHELSAFVKTKNKADNDASWYFLDPTVAMSITQKQPCICGSGEKFKRCCGVYLS